MERTDRQTQQKRRIPEMDVMKGILGLLVIMGHILYIEEVVSGVRPAGYAAESLGVFAGVWAAPYYMPAFFFVTGYCSAFKSGITTQIIADAKRLLLPAILLPFIMSEVSSLLLGNGISWSFPRSAQWFLWSLFWAKIIFIILKQYIKVEVVTWILLVIMSVAGSVMMYHMPEANYLAYQQALVFPIFLALGHKMRGMDLNPKVSYIAIVVYAVLAITSYYILRWGAPSLCAVTTFLPEKWPLFFLLATSGILGIFQISKMLKGSKILQYIGQITLVLYLVHGTFLIVVSTYMIPQITQNYNNSAFQSVFYVLMTLGALLWSCLWAELLKLPYLKWILGKW